jgi:hypothetical protein
VTGTVVRGGNSVTFRQCAVLREALELLARAQHSIHFVAFPCGRHEPAVAGFSAARRIVVRMIFDAVMYSTLSGSLLKAVVKAGGEAIRHHSSFACVPTAKGGHVPAAGPIFKLKQKRRF